MASKVIQARVPEDLYTWVAARGMKTGVVTALEFYRDIVTAGCSDREIPIEVAVPTVTHLEKPVPDTPQQAPVRGRSAHHSSCRCAECR